jgi:hypothetical protein
MLKKQTHTTHKLNSSFTIAVAKERNSTRHARYGHLVSWRRDDKLYLCIALKCKLQDVQNLNLYLCVEDNVGGNHRKRQFEVGREKQQAHTMLYRNSDTTPLTYNYVVGALRLLSLFAIIIINNNTIISNNHEG